MNPVFWFHNIRFYVLACSFLLAIVIYILVLKLVPGETLQNIRLTEIYALTAVTYLYLAVMIGPVTYLFKTLPLRGQIVKARRGIGVATFFFALIHANLAFFGQLGGFGGLQFLDSKYLIAISLSFSALIILALMAATSFDFMVAMMGFLRWKMLHRLVYLAILFITVHALLLGTQFQDLAEVIPQIFLSALAILLLLEANRFDAYLSKKIQTASPTANGVYPHTNPSWPRFGPSVILISVLIGWYLISSFGINAGIKTGLGIHSQHIQWAKDMQLQASASSNPNLPSYLQGDRTKRFTVSLLHPDHLEANQNGKLQFLVYDASSGNPVNFYTKVYEKPMHLIVVDSSLAYFAHLHPEQIENGFEITTQFPKGGVYHLYQDFQPVGAIEQQTAFTLLVDEAGTKFGNLAQTSPHFTPDSNLTKTFGDYQVSLKYPTPLKASEVSIGNQKLTFTIKDTNGNPVTNLKPYLASFGHLVMINTSTYDYLHVHPTNLTAPPPNANGGPDVEFMPLGLYGPVKPGVYRIFVQFNPDNKLFTADFTIKIEP